MSSKLRNKLNHALEMERGIEQSLKESYIKAKVFELCSKDDCYDIIKQNKITGEQKTSKMLNKTKM